ncbi:MAG: Rid family detoxifying hydrolase [Ignavibacteriae bacterium]|nr:Rid family detoxifying hydrolase [Ignavibacteriota bacterium]MCB9243736.1 deaminase [Ignavibacteriales bacterium]
MGIVKIKKERTSLYSPLAPNPIGPYSQAVSYGDLIFTSGQIGLDMDGNIVSNDVEIQTRIALENLLHILEDNNSSMDFVIKTTVYLKDMNDFTKMNEVYNAFFGESKPARSTVEVSRLPKDVKVEIDAVAYIVKKKRH